MHISRLLIHKKCIVSISLDNHITSAPNGTSKVVRAHENIFIHAGIDSVVLCPKSIRIKGKQVGRCIPLGTYEIMVNGQKAGVYTAAGIIRQLKDTEQAGHSIAGILIHHLLRNRICDVRRIIHAFHYCPVVFYIHDFYTCCPNYLLRKNNQDSCIMGRLSCDGCLYAKKRKPHIEKVKALLISCGNRVKFVAPAEYTRKMWLWYYPEYEKQTIVIPHQKANGKYSENIQPISDDEKVTVAYAGAQLEAKGWSIWKELVEGNALSGQYLFLYFGTGKETISNCKNIYVSTAEQGPDAMIEALRKSCTDAVFLGSEWGETYSYTLYESHAANAYVLAMSKGGNIPYTVQANHWGQVFESKKELSEFMKEKNRLKKEINRWRSKKKYGALYYCDNDEILRIFCKTEENNELQ